MEWRYRDGKLYAMDLTKEKSPIYNFTEEQYDITNKLVFVISCPIFKMDSQYAEKVTNEVIGVLNVESNTKAISRILQDSTRFEEIVRISNVCNKIL